MHRAPICYLQECLWSCLPSKGSYRCKNSPVILAHWDIYILDLSLPPEILSSLGLHDEHILNFPCLFLLAPSSGSLVAPFKSKWFQGGTLGLLLILVFRVFEGAVKGVSIRMHLSTQCIRMRSQAWGHWSKTITLETRVLTWLDQLPVQLNEAVRKLLGRDSCMVASTVWRCHRYPPL